MISTKLAMTTLQQEICLKKMAVGSNIESIQEVSAINHQIKHTCQTRNDEHCFGLPYQDHNYGAPPPIRQSVKHTPALPLQYPPLLLKSNLLNGNTQFNSVLHLEQNGILPSINKTNSVLNSTILPTQNGVNYAETSKNITNGLSKNTNGLSNNYNDMKKLEDVTRCICGFTHDDGYMICCDRCAVWQHIDCMNINRNHIPETYLCDFCNPRKLNIEHATLLQARKKEDFTMLSELDSDIDTGDEKDFPSYTAVQSTPTSLTITSNRGSKKNDSMGVSGKKRKRSKEEHKNAGKRSNSTDKKQSRLRSKSSCTDSIDEEFMGISFSWERKLREWKESYKEVDSSSHTPQLLQAVLTSSSKEFNDNNIEENVLFKLHRQLVKVHQLRNKLVSIGDIAIKQPVVEIKGSYMLFNQSEVTGTTQYKRPYPYVFHYNGYDGLEITVDSRTNGNISRFFRRSCCPNCEIKHIIENGKLHLFVVSKQNISNGSEITIPFDFKYQNCQYHVVCACSQFKECPVYKFTNMRLSLEHKLKTKSENRRLSPLRLSLNRIHSGESNGYASSEHDNHYHEGESEENQRKKSREERKMEAYIRQIEKMERLEKKKEQQSLLSPTDSNAKDGLPLPFNSSMNIEHNHSSHSLDITSVVTPARRVIRRRSGRGSRRQARRGRNLSMEGVTSPLTNLAESDSNNSCDLEHISQPLIPVCLSLSLISSATTTGTSTNVISTLDVNQPASIDIPTTSSIPTTSIIPTTSTIITTDVQNSCLDKKYDKPQTVVSSPSSELRELKPKDTDRIPNVTEESDSILSSAVESKTESSVFIPLPTIATEVQSVATPIKPLVSVSTLSKKTPNETEEASKLITLRRGSVFDTVKKPKVREWNYKPGKPNGQVHIGTSKRERKYVPNMGTHLKKHWLTEAFKENLVVYGPVNNPENTPYVEETVPSVEETVRSFKKQLLHNFTLSSNNVVRTESKELNADNEFKAPQESLQNNNSEHHNNHSNLPKIEYENLSDDDEADGNVSICELEMAAESTDGNADNKVNEDFTIDSNKSINAEDTASTTKKKVSLQEYLKRSKDSTGSMTGTQKCPSKNAETPDNRNNSKPMAANKSASTEKTSVLHKYKTSVAKNILPVKHNTGDAHLSSSGIDNLKSPKDGDNQGKLEINNLLKSPILKRALSDEKTNAKVIQDLSLVLDAVVGSGKGMINLEQISNKVTDLLIKTQSNKQQNSVSCGYSDSSKTNCGEKLFKLNREPTKPTKDRSRRSSKNNSPSRRISPLYTRSNSVLEHRSLHTSYSARNSSQASPITPTINSPHSIRQSGLQSPSTPKLIDNHIGQRFDRDNSLRGNFETESTRSRHNSGTSTGSSSTISRSPRRDHYNSYKQERSRDPVLQKSTSQPIPSLIRGSRASAVAYNRGSSPFSSSPPDHWGDAPHSAWSHPPRSDHHYHNNNASPSHPPPLENEYRSGKHLERLGSWPPPRDKSERSSNRSNPKSNHYYHPYPNDSRGSFYSPRDNRRSPSPQQRSPMEYYNKPPSGENFRSKYYHPDHHRR